MTPMARLVVPFLASLAVLAHAGAVRAVCCGGTCCKIDNVCRTTGEVDPSHACRHCDPGESSMQWSVMSDQCFIDSTCESDGAAGPLSCQECDPSRNQSTWSVVSGQCLIGGTCRAANEVNPSNPCQVCKPGTSQTKWSPNDGVGCDDGDSCTTSDACAGGSCGGTATDCSGLDGVCAVGRCKASDGTCEAVEASDGANCSDGEMCTVGDECQSGACVPGTDMCVDGALPGARADASASSDEDGGGTGGPSPMRGDGGVRRDGAVGAPGGGGGGESADRDGSADADGGLTSGEGEDSCGCRTVGATRSPRWMLASVLGLGVLWRARRRWR